MARKLGVSLGEVPLVVTGAQGRVGRLLRRAWELRPPEGVVPVWSGRNQPVDIIWDIEGSTRPALPAGAVVLHLAGALRGDAPTLARNAAMAVGVAQACLASGARALVAVSTAAVCAPGPRPASEDDPPAPAGPYGVAKAAAERALDAALAGSGLPYCHLRIGNIVGADALFAPRQAGAGPIVLDPVPGRDGGPVRSWIGPVTLAAALARLCLLGAEGKLPRILNLACDPPLPMAGLLAASGRDWRYGPPNPAVLPDATLSTARRRALCPLPPATPEGLMAELRLLTSGATP